MCLVTACFHRTSSTIPPLDDRCAHAQTHCLCQAYSCKCVLKSLRNESCLLSDDAMILQNQALCSVKMETNKQTNKNSLFNICVVFLKCFYQVFTPKNVWGLFCLIKNKPKHNKLPSVKSECIIRNTHSPPWAFSTVDFLGCLGRLSHCLAYYL